jgi:hypothetical protein
MVIVRILEHFQKYLYGQEFRLRTDHSALTWLMNFTDLEGQASRWIQCLQEYNVTSEHRQSRKNNNADALSQRPCREACAHCQKVEARAEVKQERVIAAVAVDGWGPATITRDERNVYDVGPILEEAEVGQRPECKDIADRSPMYKG